MLHTFHHRSGLLLIFTLCLSVWLASPAIAADYVVTGTNAVGSPLTPGTDATATEPGNLLVDGDTLVTGGVGSMSNNTSPGEDGGHATMTVGDDLTSHAVTVTGGAAGDNSTTTPEGGDGGDAALTVNGNLAASQDITLTAGHGSGGGLPNGYGGKAGSAALSVSGGLTTSQGLAITGGNGGGGGLAYGGAGGNSILSVGGGLTTTQSLDLTGGNGGGGNRAYGGAGGNSILSVGGGLTANQGLTLTGGNGGQGGSTPNSYGGVGGKVSFAGSAVSVGALNITSGMDGANLIDLGGSGGAAEFTATSLSAPAINLIRQDSALKFNVGTLWVTQATALNLDKTTAADVLVNGIVFANGSVLTVTQANAGTMTAAGNLSVTGAGNVYNSPIAWDATGKALSFSLPASLTPGQPMLSVQGDANITGATVTMEYETVRPSVAVGQRLTLLSTTGSLNGTTINLTVETANGDIYTILVENNNQLFAVLDFLSPTTPAYERLKAYAEGRAGGLAFVNQGMDLLMGQGFGSALATTAGGGPRMGAFSGFGGGSSRYDTGSHVDVNGASLLAGLAWGNDIGSSLGGRLTLGAFFEGGWGNYTSHNSFSNSASVKGDGDTSYYGGGVLGRYDLKSGLLQGTYFDASARVGRAESDFSSNDIKYNGLKADFDTSSLYYGLHGGLGYQWQLNEKAMLDFSGKLLWTRQEGDSVNVHGDQLRFKDSDSLRSRLGTRFNYVVPTESGAEFTPYVGAYWEHEFDGKAKSTVNGVGIDSPSLKGNTGVGELGISFKPATGSAFSMDLGVQGYTGVREGVTGSFQLKYEF